MGWSCSAAASDTLAQLNKLIGGTGSNSMPDGGFYETGREQPDGAIVGVVWKPAGNGCVRQAGRFRISPEGYIASFPGIAKGMKRDAEQLARQAEHSRALPDWKQRAKAIAKFLTDEPYDASAFACWDEYQTLVGRWQSLNKIAFAALVPVNPEAMAEHLREIAA